MRHGQRAADDRLLEPSLCILTARRKSPVSGSLAHSWVLRPYAIFASSAWDHRRLHCDACPRGRTPAQGRDNLVADIGCRRGGVQPRAMRHAAVQFPECFCFHVASIRHDFERGGQRGRISIIQKDPGSRTDRENLAGQPGTRGRTEPDGDRRQRVPRHYPDSAGRAVAGGNTQHQAPSGGGRCANTSRPWKDAGASPRGKKVPKGHSLTRRRPPSQSGALRNRSTSRSASVRSARNWFACRLREPEVR